MTANAALARIYGSDDDRVCLAPYLTTLPTTIDGVLDEDFEDIGWLNEDGLSESQTGSVERKRGHQGNRVVRTRMNEPGTTITFVGLETKPQTLALRYPEKNVSVTAGVRKATRGSGQRINVRSAVIDLFDADDPTAAERFVIPRFEVAPNGDKAFTSKDISAFPFVGEIIGDFFHYMKVAV